MKKFLDLGLQPLANKYLTRKEIKNKKKEQFYHLEVGFDNKTKLVSILNKVPSQKMFDNSYPYRSSMSKTMTESFKKLSKKIIRVFNPKLILEIGSNDGSLVKNFNKKKVICVEPCKNLAIITKNKGFKTYDDYWDIKLAKKIKSKYQKFDLIIANNVLAHIPNINSFVKGIKTILHNKGIATIEFQYVVDLIKKNVFDNIYHEHYFYHSFLAFSKVLKRHKLKSFDIEKVDTQGGSLRVYITHNSNHLFKQTTSLKSIIKNEKKLGVNDLNFYSKFSKQTISKKNEFLSTIIKIKKQNKTIFGYGAAAKGNTMLNFCGIKSDMINYVIDKNEFKQNKYLPGSRIPIVSEKFIKKIKPDFIVIFPWNIAKEISLSLNYIRKWGGKFIIYHPKVKIF